MIQRTPTGGRPVRRQCPQSARQTPPPPPRAWQYQTVMPIAQIRKTHFGVAGKKGAQQTIAYHWHTHSRLTDTPAFAAGAEGSERAGCATAVGMAAAVVAAAGRAGSIVRDLRGCQRHPRVVVRPVTAHRRSVRQAGAALALPCPALRLGNPPLPYFPSQYPAVHLSKPAKRPPARRHSCQAMPTCSAQPKASWTAAPASQRGER